MSYRKANKPKEIKNYPANIYDCNVVINSRLFIELIISQYYKTKFGRTTVNDEIIQDLVKQLNGQNIRRKRKYYDHEPLYYWLSSL